MLNPTSSTSPATRSPTALPSSAASSTPTASGAELGPTLTGQDLAAWIPTNEAEATGALNDVAAFCKRYCPVRLACVEDACQLYRLEGRALDALGYSRNAETEAVGVVGQSVIGLG